jgi:hypothetical protein
VIARNTMTMKHVFKHKDEVWALAPSPVNASLLFTGHHSASRHTASLWRMPGVDAGAELASDDEADVVSTPVLVRSGAAPAPVDLEPVASLPAHTSPVHSCVPACVSVDVNGHALTLAMISWGGARAAFSGVPMETQC